MAITVHNPDSTSTDAETATVRLSDGEIAAMREQLETALTEGAVGMSSGLAYRNVKEKRPPK